MLTGLQWWERAIGRLWEMMGGVEEGQWEEREGGGRTYRGRLRRRT